MLKAPTVNRQTYIYRYYNIGPTEGRSKLHTNTINILGIIFDSNLTWNQQYNKAITEANQNLHAIITQNVQKYV